MNPGRVAAFRRPYVVSAILSAAAFLSVSQLGGFDPTGGRLVAQEAPRSSNPLMPPERELAIKVKGSFTFAGVGDIIIRHPFAQLSEPAFQALIKRLKDADVGFANMEGTIIDYDTFEEAIEGGQPKALLADLKAMGIRMVTTANNHSKDSGEAGTFETIRNLNSAEIVHAGTGANLQAARAPAFYNSPKGVIGLVGVFSIDYPGFQPRFVPGVGEDPVGSAGEIFTGVRFDRRRLAIVGTPKTVLAQVATSARGQPILTSPATARWFMQPAASGTTCSQSRGLTDGVAKKRSGYHRSCTVTHDCLPTGAGSRSAAFAPLDWRRPGQLPDLDTRRTTAVLRIAPQRPGSVIFTGHRRRTVRDPSDAKHARAISKCDIARWESSRFSRRWGDGGSYDARAHRSASCATLGAHVFQGAECGILPRREARRVSVQ
jgi:Bacterial capsule synthesis protein PGA_cap